MNTEKDYLSLPLRELLADIAAKSPTPGGGSVAAVVGAISCSLARMVLEFTIGKPKYAEHEKELSELLAWLREAGETFASLMSEDMRAYRAVVAARKLDEATRQHAEARATGVPLEIVHLAATVEDRLDGIKSVVNPHLLGDLRAAAVLAHAAARSAACTVRDNLATMADQEERARVAKEMDAILDRSARQCDALIAYQP